VRGIPNEVKGISDVQTVVCVMGDSRLDVRNSAFTLKKYTPLGVFYQAHLLLIASTIANNSVKGGGGGMYIQDRANITITGSTVIDNSAGRSGGGIFVYFSNVTVTDGSRVEGNTAAETGGGLYVSYSNVTVTGGSSVCSNRALKGTGGGLFVMYNSRVTISNRSTVSNNLCLGGTGGGIAVETTRPAKFDARGRSVDVISTFGDGVLTFDSRAGYDDVSNAKISNSIIANNTSIGLAGGGLAVGGYGTIELVNGTVLLRNSAVNSSGGGVVLLRNGRLSIDDSVVFANNSVGKGFVGSTIAAFDTSTLELPHAGRLTKCSVGVYLGWSTCQAGETQQHDMCVCCPQHTFSFTNASCEACPPHANCSGGSLVQPLPDYWSSALTSVQMHRCPLSTTACN
jgi:parallel beta-helix repeat protein